MAWELREGGAVKRARSSMHEVDVDDDGITLRLEEGSGYMRADCDTHIPMTVLVQLFERAGYTLQRRERAIPEPEEDKETCEGAGLPEVHCPGCPGRGRP